MSSVRHIPLWYRQREEYVLTVYRAIDFFFFSLHLSLAGNSGCLTWVRLQQPQEQRYPFLTVRAVFSCVPRKVWLPMLGIFNVRTDVNACTVRESALKVDSGRKLPCRTRESNLPQRRVCPTRYRLSYFPAPAIEAETFVMNL